MSPRDWRDVLAGLESHERDRADAELLARGFEGLSADEAYRALDLVERLLAEWGSREALAVGDAKAAVIRAAAPPTTGALLAEPLPGLRPWRDVIEPHDDVARGRFALAEFAADLHQVAFGEGADGGRAASSRPNAGNVPTQTASSAPTRSTQSCSRASTGTGRRSSASSGPAACCASWPPSCTRCGRRATRHR